MTAARSRASEVRLPSVGERQSMRPDENAFKALDPRKRPTNNGANDTSCLKTLEFGDFINHTDNFRPQFDLLNTSRLGPWMEVHLGAVRELPHGGVIAIPLPSSTDDLRAIDQTFQGSYYHSKDRVLFGWTKESLEPHPHQEACSNWASLGWNRWLEHATKPKLVVFESSGESGFQMKDQNWSKDDLIDTGRKGTVKLWFSRHISTSPMSPAHMSAEFHIIRNSLVRDEQSARDDASEAVKCVRIMLLHMSSRQIIQPAYLYFPLLYHRISIFRATHLHTTPSSAATAQWRDKGRFPATGSATNISVPRKPWFFESCISIIARFKNTRDGDTLRAVFIIKDADVGDLSIGLSGKSFKELSLRERSGFLPTLLREYYRSWEEGWNGCLDGIDDSVKITLEDLSDDTKLDTFMFDGTNFERSRSYFAALQLLRIFSDRIKETRQDLVQAIKALGQDVSLFESTGLEEAESRLLQRIDRKTEEIKTLRDGLFNSTSVREATRATQMNRYVIVFTVVTVLYTPPSFISALFATPLPHFTKGDPDDFKRAVGIATGTTVLAAIILLIIANSFDDVIRNPKDRLNSSVESMWTRGRDLLAQSKSLTRIPIRAVRETGRSLRDVVANFLQRQEQAWPETTESRQPGGLSSHRHSEEDIDLPVLAANAATPRNAHGGHIV